MLQHSQRPRSRTRYRTSGRPNCWKGCRRGSKPPRWQAKALLLTSQPPLLLMSSPSRSRTARAVGTTRAAIRVDKERSRRGDWSRDHRRRNKDSSSATRGISPISDHRRRGRSRSREKSRRRSDRKSEKKTPKKEHRRGREPSQKRQRREAAPSPKRSSKAPKESKEPKETKRATAVATPKPGDSTSARVSSSSHSGQLPPGWAFEVRNRRAVFVHLGTGFTSRGLPSNPQVIGRVEIRVVEYDNDGQNIVCSGTATVAGDGKSARAAGGKEAGA